MYDLFFSDFGRPPVPNDLYKDSALQGMLGSGEEDF